MARYLHIPVREFAELRRVLIQDGPDKCVRQGPHIVPRLGYGGRRRRGDYRGVGGRDLLAYADAHACGILKHEYLVNPAVAIVNVLDIRERGYAVAAIQLNTAPVAEPGRGPARPLHALGRERAPDNAVH